MCCVVAALASDVLFVTVLLCCCIDLDKSNNSTIISVYFCNQISQNIRIFTIEKLAFLPFQQFVIVIADWPVCLYPVCVL